VRFPLLVEFATAAQEEMVAAAKDGNLASASHCGEGSSQRSDGRRDDVVTVAVPTTSVVHASGSGMALGQLAQDTGGQTRSAR
jgi:hypothetical protein